MCVYICVFIYDIYMHVYIYILYIHIYYVQTTTVKPQRLDILGLPLTI